MESIFFILLAATIGLATVIQGAFNQRVGQVLDLNLAILINSLVVLVISALVYVLARSFPQILPNAFATRSFEWNQLTQLGWRVILPGLCGFTIVAGIPWALSRLTALKVFFLIVVSQIFFSFLWDYFVLEVTLSGKRLVGVLVALAGVLITIL
ncbi:MAG: hypothetical protein COV44_11695 [Deltaproteobacteria bacterium CG11_big_fil_rev_8_21_14_0_20_45_16]|nr:MAG: hypothetical protein COV44_11695 [Deltaproteobacteria bacterium CG11_big_fil_rev_8_21_14_0_20_45_16]